MAPENREKVLERLATTEKATLVIERQPDGKYLSHQALGWQEGVSDGSGARSAQCRWPAACLSKRAPARRVGPAGRALRPVWTGRLARLRGHHVSAYVMTVIDNAVPVITPGSRRCAMRRNYGTVADLDGSQREAAW